MGSQKLLHFGPFQFHRLRRRGNQFKQFPEPGLINSGTDLDHLREVAAQGVSQLVPGADLLLLDILIGPGELTDPNHQRVVQSHTMRRVSTILRQPAKEFSDFLAQSLAC